MSTQTANTSVTSSVVVDAPIEKAFSVFTDGIATWWSPDHHVLQTNFDLCHSGPRKLLPALTRVVGIPIIHDVNKTKQQALEAEDGTRNRYLGWPDQLPRAAIG